MVEPPPPATVERYTGHLERWDPSVQDVTPASCTIGEKRSAQLRERPERFKIDSTLWAKRTHEFTVSALVYCFLVRAVDPSPSLSITFEKALQGKPTEADGWISVVSLIDMHSPVPRIFFRVCFRAPKYESRATHFHSHVFWSAIL